MQIWKSRGQCRISRGCDCASCSRVDRTIVGKRRRWNDHDGGRRVISLELRAYGDAYGGQRRNYRAPLKFRGGAGE